MNTHKLKHISAIIDSSFSKLDQLSHTAQRKTSLSKYLKKNLKNFGQYIVSAHINDSGILVIEVTSPELAARLKYEEQEIMILCKSFGDIPERIKIRSI